MKAIMTTENVTFAKELETAVQLHDAADMIKGHRKYTMFDWTMVDKDTDIDRFNVIGSIAAQLMYLWPDRVIGIVVPEDVHFEMQTAIRKAVDFYSSEMQRKYDSWDGFPNNSTYMWRADNRTRIVLTTYEIERYDDGRFRGCAIDYAFAIDLNNTKYYDDFVKAFLPVQLSGGYRKMIIVGNRNRGVSAKQFGDLWVNTKECSKVAFVPD